MANVASRRVARLALAIGSTLALIATPVSAGSGDTTVKFGMPWTGSDCVPPACFDDASFHAKDTITPAVVSIPVGSTLTAAVAGFHQAVLYEAGTRLSDIEPNPLSFPFVNDPDGVIAAAPPLTDLEYTFTSPGRYLLICNITPHFEEARMYAVVIVR
jgi:plastocyanin